VAPDHPVIIYDLARAYALSGHSQQALSCLEKVTDIGGLVAFGAARDKNFASISDSEEFKQVVNKIESMKKPVINSDIAYTLAGRDLLPESLAYDLVTHSLYLSNKSKNRILNIDEPGQVRNFISEKQDGIWGISSIEVDPKRRILWAVANNDLMQVVPSDTEMREVWNSCVFKFDLTSGKLIRKYLLGHKPGVHLLSDLVVSSRGDLFITDVREGSIYMITAKYDELEMFLKMPRLKFARSIAISDDDRYLFIAHGLGVEMIDLWTQYSYTLTHPENMTLTGIEGLSFYRGSLIAHQTAALGRIARYYLSEDFHSVERMETIDAHRPDFNIPATGTVAGDFYCYAALSQSRNLRERMIFPENKLRDVIILRAKL
jgi:hypothetical protein